jgi:acetyl esterase/lipase
MSNESQPLDRSQLERARKPIVYRTPRMDEAMVHSNLKYTDTAEPRLLMDIYAPPNTSTGSKRAGVLMIHGGVPAPLPVKDMGIFQSWGRLIAAHDMIAMSFTHRLQWPLAHLPESAADVRSALDFARSNAAKFGIDADRLCVMAWSAGGLLLSVAVADRREYVRCQVAFYPLLEAEPMAENFALRKYARAHPFPPLFIARAGNDANAGLNDRLDRFTSDAIAANAPITFVNHPTGLHGFDVDNDDERSKEIIRSTLTFLQAHTREQEVRVNSSASDLPAPTNREPG